MISTRLLPLWHSLLKQGRRTYIPPGIVLQLPTTLANMAMVRDAEWLHLDSNTYFIAAPESQPRLQTAYQRRSGCLLNCTSC